MNKFIKTILIVLCLITASVCFVACDDGANADGKKGLLYKRYGTDDFYTVYDYVDDGTGITSLNLGDYNKDGVVIGAIKEGAFKENDTLTEIIVPTTVTEIGEGVFAKMTKLEKVTLPFIGKNANSDTFYGETASSVDKAIDKERTFGYLFGTESYDKCAEVKQAHDPDSSINVYMPLSLKEVTIEPKEAYGIPYYAFNGNPLITKVNLSDKIDAIGDNAFTDCYLLNTLTIPANVERIGVSAFEGCLSLKNTNEGKGLTIVSENSKLKTICEKAFMATKLEKFVVPALVESIGNYAFASELSGVEIAENGASMLKEITLNANLKTIGKAAFIKCEKLETVVIDSATTQLEIGVKAFEYCKNLKKFGKATDTYTTRDIHLESVESLGANAFAYIGGDAITVTGLTGKTFEAEKDNIFYGTTIA